MKTFTFNAAPGARRILLPVSIRQSFSFFHNFGYECSYSKATALLDTGASGSCISGLYARRNKFISLCDCEVLGVGGKYVSKVYYADIMLPGDILIRDIEVTDFFDNGKFDVIIGMDIITTGDFALSNYNDQMTVSFRCPPVNPPIDFGKLALGL